MQTETLMQLVFAVQSEQTPNETPMANAQELEAITLVVVGENGQLDAIQSVDYAKPCPC